MAKWYGTIGYVTTSESEDNPGVWVSNIIEKPYYGDLTGDYKKRQDGTGTNDNINMTNVVSILADPYAINNCSNMAYATIRGTKWKITNIEVQFPRLILSIGGVYNG